VPLKNLRKMLLESKSVAHLVLNHLTVMIVSRIQMMIVLVVKKIASRMILMEIREMGGHMVDLVHLRNTKSLKHPLIL
jgi:hypothetical protein